MVRKKQQYNLDGKLILKRWMLSLFGVESFEAIAKWINSPSQEGYDEKNISRYYYAIRSHLPSDGFLNKDILLEYDENIYRHWKRITTRRNRSGYPLSLKYFQYLSLLFTEIYLDLYFRDKQILLDALNEKLEAHNTDAHRYDTLPAYTDDDLNKIAFWQATGSGKTLVMHCNLLQFQHYLKKHGRPQDINRMILLTPNEGLSQQHLDEFRMSGISAEMFSKDRRSIFTGQAIEIIDIHKLQDEMGDKTVAVAAFEDNNLVLVDEGHRGSSGNVWKARRDALCERGFSFEYSATFGQAMKAAKDAALTEEYAKCILVDYSYRFFYGDGYGKDYHILNLADDKDKETRLLYLTACLLGYHQQNLLYKEHHSALQPYLIERPLWAFVGSRVTKSLSKKNRSDIAEILHFLSIYLGNRRATEDRIERILSGTANLRDEKGRDIFTNVFNHLQSRSASQIYHDTLQFIFNATSPASLHIEELKEAEGELGLRVGNNDYFGVINVGDAGAFRRYADKFDEYIVSENEFGRSLFDKVNDDKSKINIVIGAKKFIEGWNSWRVSTMGLMNVGKGEGSEIIQLFGRGVRLKGHEFSLKRSTEISNLQAPEYLQTLETLNIFGIHSDYMQQFKEYLEDEGLPTNESRIEFSLPVIQNLGKKKLHVIRVKEGINFEQDGQKPILDLPPEHLQKHPVTIDWYPKVQTTFSRDIIAEQRSMQKSENHFTEQHIPFLDLEKLYFQLLQFKSDRGWHHLSIPLEVIEKLLRSANWYRLYIPEQELAFKDFSRVQKWEEIALSLLKKYCAAYYRYRKNEFESPHLEYQELSPDDPNIINEYNFLIEESRQDIIDALKELKPLIESGQLKPVKLPNFATILFSKHL